MKKNAKFCQKHKHNQIIQICIQPNCDQDSRVLCTQCMEECHLVRSSHNLITIKRLVKLSNEFNIILKKTNHYKSIIQNLAQNIKSQIQEFTSYMSNLFVFQSEQLQKLNYGLSNYQQLNKIARNEFWHQIVRLDDKRINKQQLFIQKNIQNLQIGVRNQIFKICEYVKVNFKQIIKPFTTGGFHSVLPYISSSHQLINRSISFISKQSFKNQINEDYTINNLITNKQKFNKLCQQKLSQKNNLLIQKITDISSNFHTDFVKKTEIQMNLKIQQIPKLNQLAINNIYAHHSYQFSSNFKHLSLKLQEYNTKVTSKQNQKYCFCLGKEPFSQVNDARYFLVSKGQNSNVQFLIGATDQTLLSQQNNNNYENNFGYGKGTYLIYGYPKLNKLIIFSTLSKKKQDFINTRLTHSSILKVVMKNSYLIFSLEKPIFIQIGKLIYRLKPGQKLYPVVGIKGFGSVKIIQMPKSQKQL